jgi:hypothetical protein
MAYSDQPIFPTKRRSLTLTAVRVIFLLLLLLLLVLRTSPIPPCSHHPPDLNVRHVQAIGDRAGVDPCALRGVFGEVDGLEQDFVLGQRWERAGSRARVAFGSDSVGQPAVLWFRTQRFVLWGRVMVTVTVLVFTGTMEEGAGCEAAAGLFGVATYGHAFKIGHTSWDNPSVDGHTPPRGAIQEARQGNATALGCCRLTCPSTGLSLTIESSNSCPHNLHKMSPSKKVFV